MSRTVWINGDWLPEQQATVSVFDRGFLFADAIYEVTAVIDGKLVDFDGHMARLRRSCQALEIACPWDDEALRTLHQELISRNRLDEGAVYLQLTRGDSGDRSFLCPEGTAPTLVLFTQARAIVDVPQGLQGIRVITCPDIRWGRRDIKTVGLLAACMAKQEARSRGADDALLVEQGFITEGASSNVFIVTRDNRLVTRPLDNNILHGITRGVLLKLAQRLGIEHVERPFTPAEAREASEVFISSATSLVWPVVAIDGVTIGDGAPGPFTRRLREHYIAALREQIA